MDVMDEDINDLSSLLNEIAETSVANSSSSYLEGKTLTNISQEIYDSLQGFSDEFREKYYEQLAGEFRYVEKVCDLRLGVYTKCLTILGKKVGKGGILVKVDVYEDKISLLCKMGAYFQRHSFNDSVVFQKMSLDEKMVLISNEYCYKSEKK
jgi:hypothetical protein